MTIRSKVSAGTMRGLPRAVRARLRRREASPVVRALVASLLDATSMPVERVGSAAWELIIRNAETLAWGAAHVMANDLERRGAASAATRREARRAQTAFVRSAVAR